MYNILVKCPFCNADLDPAAFFCPSCGKKVREKPVSTAFWAQAALYAVSVLLPPFGIGMTIRYLRSPDKIAKRAGWISVVLTSLALVVVFWSTYVMTKSISDQVNQSLKQYQGMGY